MKLKFFSCFILVTLLVRSTLASTTEFEKLFKLEYCDQHLILSTQDNIELPDSYLNSIQRLYRYIKLFCKLELYLINEDSTLVIVPYNRLNLFYNTAVCIKLLRSIESKNFIFTNTEKPEDISQKSYTSSNNSTINIELDCYDVSIKQFLANDNTIKYLIDQLEYGMLDLPSQIFFATLLQPIYTTDYLININYNQQQLPCLFKGNTNCYSRYYLLSKLVASDLASYLHKTYSCIKDRVQNYRGKQQIQTTPPLDPEVITQQTEEIETSEITQEQRDISEEVSPLEPEIITEQTEEIELSEITQEQLDVSEEVSLLEPEIITQQTEETELSEITQEQRDISEEASLLEPEIITQQTEETELSEITQEQRDISEEVSPLEPEIITTSSINSLAQHPDKQQLETQKAHLHPALSNQSITANIDLTTGKIYY